MALDPSPVYKNSGGSYATSKNYWIGVSAIFDQGEGAMSAPAKPVIPNVGKAQAPSAKGYNNGNATGYFDLSWKAVSGATGYKVQVFNGKGFETLDLGNQTSWTTKGKKIWPTSAEIKAGKYALHLKDGSGAELPINPGPTYKNAGEMEPKEITRLKLSHTTKTAKPLHPRLLPRHFLISLGQRM